MHRLLINSFRAVQRTRRALTNHTRKINSPSYAFDSQHGRIKYSKTEWGETASRPATQRARVKQSISDVLVACHSWNNNLPIPLIRAQLKFVNKVADIYKKYSILARHFERPERGYRRTRDNQSDVFPFKLPRRMFATILLFRPLHMKVCPASNALTAGLLWDLLYRTRKARRRSLGSSRRGIELDDRDVTNCSRDRWKRLSNDICKIQYARNWRAL